MKNLQSLPLLKPIRVCTTLALFALPLLLPAQTLTAAEAIRQVQQRHPAMADADKADTVDTIKAGDPATPVHGIATTFLDTMDVLREADRRGLNLVITHEPTFYNHRDATAFFKDDPVYREKLAFIEQHHMVVFRLHDAIHDTQPDPIAMGLIEALGWQGYIQPKNPFLAAIPRTTLGTLAAHLETSLHAPTMRVIGDPNVSITHVALLPGAAGLEKQVTALRQSDVDVLIAGEASEWETVEYARDATAQGRHKAIILLGHEVSEEPGMEQCAKELKTLFPTLKVEHILAGSPTWSPEHPPSTNRPAAPAE